MICSGINRRKKVRAIRRSRIEQETIFLFNEEEKTASVYTFNKSLQKKLAILAKERPEECYLDKPQNTLDGAVEYIVPKKWIKIRANRILSDEERAALSERAKIMREGVAEEAEEPDFEDD